MAMIDGTEWSYPLNLEEYINAEVVQLWHYGRTTGVFSADNNLRVTPAGAMQVNVSSGAAWLRYSQFGGIVYANMADKILQLDLGEPVLHRIDRICVRFNIVSNNVALAIRKGTPASNPVPPALQRDMEFYEIAVFDIRINAGTTSITQAMISDKRLDESVCGIVRDGVAGIPTQALYDSWYTWFSALTMDAEQRATEFTNWLTVFRMDNEQDVQQWVSNFKQSAQDDLDAWFGGFTMSSTSTFSGWYTAFKTNSEDDFNTWFQDLKNVLDGDQAANLYNMIDQHRSATILIEDGVHGLRYFDGLLQVYDNGWITLSSVIRGLRWSFIDALNHSWQIWDNMDYSWNEFENLIERESM